RGSLLSWRESSDCVSLGRAKADSPSPRNGSKYPVPQIGPRNIPRVVQTGDGECLEQENTTASFIRARAAAFGGFATGIAVARLIANQPTPRTGRKPKGNCVSGFRLETATFST